MVPEGVPSREVGVTCTWCGHRGGRRRLCPNCDAAVRSAIERCLASARPATAEPEPEITDLERWCAEDEIAMNRGAW